MAMVKEAKEKVIKQHAKSPNDTGSHSVQVALLTEEINQLTEHCRKNPKDFSTRRGLLKKVCRRRQFINYLSRKNEKMPVTVTEDRFEV